ncbi:MAG: hypothetical protein ACRDJW_06995 [Thermomicrobiales bacterium]
MAKTIRYYITRDADQPVVRSIPVSVRPVEATSTVRPHAENSSAPQKDSRVPVRVAQLLRSAVRRALAAR